MSLIAQIETSDTGIGRSRKRNAGSLVACLEALGPGESYIHNAEIFGVVLGSEEAYQTLKAKREELRSRTHIGIQRARKANPAVNFTTETNDTITAKGRMFVTVIITRTDDPLSEDDI